MAKTHNASIPNALAFRATVANWLLMLTCDYSSGKKLYIIMYVVEWTLLSSAVFSYACDVKSILSLGRFFAEKENNFYYQC